MRFGQLSESINIGLATVDIQMRIVYEEDSICSVETQTVWKALDLVAEDERTRLLPKLVGEVFGLAGQPE